jgi:K+/H+ antiporter YhaU regulatory subunit KhtT
MKRNGAMVISPGPYALILEGDILLIIGDEQTYERVIHFLTE